MFMAPTHSMHLDFMHLQFAVRAVLIQRKLDKPWKGLMVILEQMEFLKCHRKTIRG